VQSANGFWVDWVAHRGNKDTCGCLTHAVPIDGPSSAVCGVETGGEGAVLTLAEASGVGCQRCTVILQKRGILLAATN
jgi:hypothetical protein